MRPQEGGHTCQGAALASQRHFVSPNPLPRWADRRRGGTVRCCYCFPCCLLETASLERVSGELRRLEGRDSASSSRRTHTPT